MANRALFHAVLAVTNLIDGRRRLGGDSVFGTRNALRARVCLYPAAVPDAEKRGQSLAGDYRDDCAVADRSAAECIEYLYVQRALRLDCRILNCLRVFRMFAAMNAGVVLVAGI